LTNFILALGIHHPDVYDPLWSLGVEEQFYLAWPLAVYFLDRRRLRWTCWFLILLAPGLRGAFHFQHHWPIYALTPFRMDLLAVGGLLQLEWRERREMIEKWSPVVCLPLLALGIGILLVFSHFGVTTYGNTRLGNVLIYEACLLVCLGVMLHALGGQGVRWLEFPALTYVGKISYSMYLIHLLIITLVLKYANGAQGVLVALVLTVGYGTASWYGFERRLLSSKKSSRVLALEHQ
jgi:peptidoglycan/LPS O-acetylase OafA/YrhL